MRRAVFLGAMLLKYGTLFGMAVAYSVTVGCTIGGML